MGFLSKRSSTPAPERPSQQTRPCPKCKGKGEYRWVRHPSTRELLSGAPNTPVYGADECGYCNGTREVS